MIANCGLPDLLPMVNNDSVPRVVGNDHLPIEGSTITFSCLLGFTLTGPSSATCTDKGVWDPDPSGLMCNYSEGYYYDSVLNVLS